MMAEPIAAKKLTWWVCRTCNRVRAYTADDLKAIPGRRPVCVLCDDGVRRFMQRIRFDHKEVS